MPSKFKLNVDDPVVHHVLKVGTNKNVRSDVQIIAAMVAEGIVGDLTVDDFNRKFGPRTGCEYEVASVGLLRRHYRFGGQRRCLYGVLTEQERHEGLTLDYFKFPTADARHEVWGTSANVGEVEMPEPDDVRGKRRPSRRDKTHTSPHQKIARPEQVPADALLELLGKQVDEQHEESVNTLRRENGRLYRVVDDRDKTIANLKYEKHTLRNQLDAATAELERLRREVTDHL